MSSEPGERVLLPGLCKSVQTARAVCVRTFEEPRCGNGQAMTHHVPSPLGCSERGTFPSCPAQAAVGFSLTTAHANSGFSFQNHSRFCEGLGPRHEVQPYFMIPTEQDEMTAIVQVFPFFCCRLHSELKGYVSALLNEMSAIWRGKNAAVGGTNVKYHYYLAFFIKS